MFTDHKQKISYEMFYAQPLIGWRLRLKEHRPKIIFIKGIHNTIAYAISRLGYDPSVNQTAESYFTMKVNKKSKVVRDRTGRQSQMQWCKLNVFTSKREDFNLMFTINGKEDGIYPLKRDSKAQKKDQRSIVTTCKNTYKGFVISTYWEHNSVI